MIVIYKKKKEKVMYVNMKTAMYIVVKYNKM